ncbi:MAG: polysaccharide biosynthesis protein [Acholeplasmatales bacterium]|nr:polysaccharide biosynthesis protein [Acholeplasmatales bacterium]
MNKRTIYTLGLMLIDFIALFVICLFGVLLITKDFARIDSAFIISALCISFIKVLVGYLLKTYKMLWMYSIRRNLFKLILISLLVDFVFLVVSMIPEVGHYTGVRTSIVIAIVLFEFAYLVTSRFAISVYFNYFYKRKERETASKQIPTIIIGAGSAGAMVLNEIGVKPEYGFKIVGFVDDSKDKIGQVINNVKVYGPISEINEIIDKVNAKKVIIAIPSVGFAKLKEITNLIDYKKVEVLILPDKAKLLHNDITSTIRKVEIADLLGRHEISLNNEAVTNFYKGKVVLVTGGGGSIGSELCRQIAKMQPKKLVILDIYENCAYEIQQELKFKYKNDLDLQVEIVSITNRPAMERVFAAHKPNIVVMAAAHKHVPLMEYNVIEAVENNVFGTLNTVEMAEKYGADRVHMVSTDKAVNPTSIMGATKRICEMIVQAHSTIKQHTTFSITRFGNVLGSAGSVIPLFKRQIEAGGPITLTDYRIIRYFMTIPEASQLVLTSSSMAKNGELFVLDMGQPVKIYDLALNMIKLSGLEYKRDIDIIETGLRPGEKLYEELLVKTEELDKTDNELIFIERDKPLSLEDIASKLEKLSKGIKEGNDAKMKDIIKSVVPTFIEKEQANKNFDGKEVK